MIEPDKPPTDVESVVPLPPDKTQAHDDLVFLQRCFNETLSGELENWPVETFRAYRATLSRLHNLLEAVTPTYGECIARTAILELSRKISASWKGRNVMDQLTGLKH